jgi:hypothetical protein
MTSSIKYALMSAAALVSTTASAIAASDDYSGHRAVLHYAEYITDALSGEEGGITVFQHDTGNGQLTSDWVYGDPRRALFNGGLPNVTHAVQTDFPSADAGLLNQTADFFDAVAVWDNQQCSNMMLVRNSSSGKGVVDRFFETGVINLDWTADLTQIGFLNSTNFEYFTPGSNVLGVTFTLSWVDANGKLTDIDNNGKADVAFREIYYNDRFNWSDNGSTNTDLPSVAYHEVGHGFSMAHFGLIAVKNGALFVSPRAIMNAVYPGGQYRTPAGRDVGSHCSNWAQWPNK